MSFVVSTALGLYLFRGWPFPAENNMLQMVLLQKPYLYHGMNHGFHSTSSLLWQEKHDLNAIQDHVGHPSSSSTLVLERDVRMSSSALSPAATREAWSMLQLQDETGEGNMGRV